MSFFSKLFGGSKSEKDVKKIQPFVGEINNHFASFQSFTNDQLRNKTVEFRQRIKAHGLQLIMKFLRQIKEQKYFNLMICLVRMPFTRK